MSPFKLLGSAILCVILSSCSILQSLDEKRRAVPNADSENKEYVNKSLHPSPSIKEEK